MEFKINDLIIRDFARISNSIKIHKPVTHSPTKPNLLNMISEMNYYSPFIY